MPKRIKTYRHQPSPERNNGERVNYRLIFIFIITSLGFLGVAGKLFMLQIWDHSYYQEKARKNAENRRELPAKRGTIFDRQGRILARDILQYSIALSGKRLKNRQKVINELVSTLNLSAAEINQKLRKNSSFAYLAHKVLPKDAERLKKLKDPGVILEKRFLRVYPYRFTAAHVLGFCDLDNKALGGIEYQYNEYLQGKPGWTIFQRDALGGQLPDLDYEGEEPVDGLDVTLTIDIDYQTIVDDELRSTVEANRATDGMAVLMDPVNGEIYALSNYPSFDPFRPNHYDKSVLKNRVLTDVFEPGSTYKVVTLAAALERLQLKLDQEMIACENGQYKLYGQVFTDYKKYGVMSARKVFEHSSNIGVVKIAQKLKREILYKYSRNFGFGMPTGVDLPGESSGILNPLDKFSKTTHLFMSFGYEVGVTPLQLTSAYSAVANGGKLMKPFLMQKITRENGKVVKENEPELLRKVLSEQTTRLMTTVLQGVVKDGSGKEAFLSELPIAGKTGTAQLYDKKTRRHDSSKHLASFVGYFPAQSPRFVLLIMIRQPRGNYYGGLVAAPAFRNIARRIINLNTDQALRYAANSQKSEETPVTVKLPRVENLDIKVAEKILEDLDLKVKVSGEGNIVSRQQVIKEDNQIVGVSLFLEDESKSRRKLMPALTGMSLKEALSTLNNINLTAEVAGHGVVISQHPKPGSKIDTRKPVKLVCKPT